MSEQVQAITASDLRAEIARSRVKIYRVAARARLHPMTIGRILNEKRPLTKGYADRILRAIREEGNGGAVEK